MKKNLIQLVFQAITVDENYLSNMLEIHRVLNKLEKHELILTEEGIVPYKEDYTKLKDKTK